MALNEDQLKVVNSTSRTILVLAGAGAGKTFTLISRIKRLIDSGVNPRSILSLTFTNAAAFEMAERFKKMCPGPIQPEFRTFHGFAYSVIVKEPKIREALNYSKIPEICDDKDMKRIKTELKLKLNIKLSDDQLSQSSTLGWSLKDKHEFEVFNKALRKELLAQNLITFDMLNRDVSELFASHHPSVQRFLDQYKYIQVDEYQDTDDDQTRFLNSFDDTTNFCMFADALQNIYGFRGTTNKYVKLLSTNPDWEVIKLPKNYRSTRQICEFANRMSTYASPSYRIEMEGQRDGDDVLVYYGACADYINTVDDKHAKIVIESIKKSDEDGAILCRTNKEVEYMCRRLDDAHIPYTRSNKTNDDIDIIQSALDNEYMLKWLSTFLDARHYADYIRNSAQQAEPDIKWFLNIYGNNEKIKPKANKVIEVRKVVTSGLSAHDKLIKLDKVFKADIPIPDDCSQLTNNRLILEYIQDRLNDVIDHRLYVGTIHSSKGLEYGHVYLMGVNDKCFPIDSEEARNLYYVGITRAKNHLSVFKG